MRAVQAFSTCEGSLELLKSNKACMKEMQQIFRGKLARTRNLQGGFYLSVTEQPRDERV